MKAPAQHTHGPAYPWPTPSSAFAHPQHTGCCPCPSPCHLLAPLVHPIHPVAAPHLPLHHHPGPRAPQPRPRPLGLQEQETVTPEPGPVWAVDPCPSPSPCTVGQGAGLGDPDAVGNRAGAEGQMLCQDYSAPHALSLLTALQLIPLPWIPAPPLPASLTHWGHVGCTHMWVHSHCPPRPFRWVHLVGMRSTPHVPGDVPPAPHHLSGSRWS